MKKHIYLFLALLLPFIVLTGCQVTVVEPGPPPPPPVVYGPNGAPGFAYFGVDWTEDTPDFISTNNAAIPQYFRYGDYYNSGSGVYDFYYEGSFFDGPNFVEYWWEGVYEVWVNPGQPGCECGTPGADGFDSFLMMVTNPYGPFESRTNKTMTADHVKVISATEDMIVVEMEKYNLGMRITYNKLTKSKKADIPADWVKIAQ